MLKTSLIVPPGSYSRRTFFKELIDYLEYCMDAVIPLMSRYAIDLFERRLAMDKMVDRVTDAVAFVLKITDPTVADVDALASAYESWQNRVGDSRAIDTLSVALRVVCVGVLGSPEISVMRALLSLNLNHRDDFPKVRGLCVWDQVHQWLADKQVFIDREQVLRYGQCFTPGFKLFDKVL